MPRRLKTLLFLLLGSALMQACSSGPSRTAQTRTALPQTSKTALIDKTYYHQQDPRWSTMTLGGSNEPLASDGCLVTSAAMALSNLGFQTNPGDLVTRLKSVGGFNNRGWLVWSGLDKVTGGIASTRFYKAEAQSRNNDTHVRSCIADGFYPLVKLTLPSRRSHWVVVVDETEKGFYIRDPMVSASTPIPLSSRATGIDSVRCVGVEKV